MCYYLDSAFISHCERAERNYIFQHKRSVACYDKKQLSALASLREAQVLMGASQT